MNPSIRFHEHAKTVLKCLLLRKDTFFFSIGVSLLQQGHECYGIILCTTAEQPLLGKLLQNA